MWIFGYGSLMWRPGFAYAERRDGYVEGYERRFYQGSPDHRGVPSAPGRVVTLVPRPGAQCWGVAYRVEGAEAARVLPSLDHREKAGYERLETAMTCRDGGVVSKVMAYVAGRANPSYLGPASVAAMARQIATSRGPSGANADYLFELAACLDDLNVDEPHVHELVVAVRARL